MKHHIIAKFNEQVTDKAALIAEIRGLFAKAADMPEIRGVQVLPNIIDRPNRYDVMIVLEMDPASLSVWDDCEIHHTWKDRYGKLLEKKAIFDCD